jgi:hypothetical protein
MSFFFCLSIVFVVLLLKTSMQFVAGWIVAKSAADESVFYSPYLFPVFSYKPSPTTSWTRRATSCRSTWSSC